jgi:predicted enzyme related to lactoylglutathione lyase
MDIRWCTHHYFDRMNTSFACNHVVIETPSIDRARIFYAETLGLELLESDLKLFAVKAGDIRFSFFESDGEAHTPNAIKVILRTSDIESSFATLKAAGVTVLEEIIVAPGFMKFFTIADPDGNVLFVAEYLRDPLGKA